MYKAKGAFPLGYQISVINLETSYFKHLSVIASGYK